MEKLIEYYKALDAVLWGCTYITKINVVTGKKERLFEAENRALVEAALRIGEIEPADAVEVVRCKDCEHYHSDHLRCRMGLRAHDDDFCSQGRRKADASH